MPPKKRTDQTKRTPHTTPSASTSHTSPDQRLRHTGPSINTRSRVSGAPSQPVPAHAQPGPAPESTLTQVGPPEKKLNGVVSPVARKPFVKLFYVPLFCVLLLLGWYIYGTMTLLERLKEEVGWRGIIKGDWGGRTRWDANERCGSGTERSALPGEGGLEGSLNVLADALGISPVEIASALKPVIPPARLSSISYKSVETSGSEAVRMLFEDAFRDDGADATRKMREEDQEKSGA